DVLELNFWGVQNFKLRLVLDLEGRAFVPKVGYLNLQGKTLQEVRELLRRSVGRLYPRLNFDAALAEPRTFVVQVVDQVTHPGSYTARAVERVATIVGKAGGFTGVGSKRRIQITRRDGTAFRADLIQFAVSGDVKHNPYLLDGDI